MSPVMVNPSRFSVPSAEALAHGGQSIGAGAVYIGPAAFYDHAVIDSRFDTHYDAAT